MFLALMIPYIIAASCIDATLMGVIGNASLILSNFNVTVEESSCQTCSTTDEVIITTDGMLSTTDKVISTTTSMITSMVSGNTIDFQRSITILLQHQQQVQKLLLQQQRRQKEPQRRLRPQPLRQRQLQQSRY
ncbi:unnamed protein product [Rotaria magnacalcarata]|uniref:Uncharacterized protein n=1 Tax=Rotaria magnacalcarata TaxID=392030 RepID=A0A816GSK0_9BILA|nr:unnamed protein product [Rotaria magnacalcarata]